MFLTLNGSLSKMCHKIHGHSEIWYMDGCDFYVKLHTIADYSMPVWRSCINSYRAKQSMWKTVSGPDYWQAWKHNRAGQNITGWQYKKI